METHRSEVRELRQELEVFKQAYGSVLSNMAGALSGIRSRVGSVEAKYSHRGLPELLALHLGKRLPKLRSTHVFLTDSGSVVPPTSLRAPASINQSGGYATLRELSRVNLLAYETEQAVHPSPNLRFSMEHSTSGGVVESNDPQNAVTGDPGSPWYRHVRIPGTQGTDGRITTVLSVYPPSDLQSSAAPNLLELRPWPEGITTIEKVEVVTDMGAATTVWRHGGPHRDGPALSIPLSADLIEEIRITVTSGAPRVEGRYNEFTYGLAHLGLYSVVYADRGDFSVSVRPSDGERIIGVRGLTYNESRPGLQNLIETGALDLEVVAHFASGNRAAVLRTTGEGAEEAVLAQGEWDEPATHVTINGVLRASGPNPPRVFDVGSILITEGGSIDLVAGEVESSPGAIGDYIWGDPSEQTPNGSTTEFSWGNPAIPFDPDRILIFVGGRLQVPGVDYTRPAGPIATSVTFDVAPITGEYVQIFAAKAEVP